MKFELVRTCDSIGAAIKMTTESVQDEIIHGLLETNQNNLELFFDWDPDSQTFIMQIQAKEGK